MTLWLVAGLFFFAGALISAYLSNSLARELVFAVRVLQLRGEMSASDVSAATGGQIRLHAAASTLRTLERHGVVVSRTVAGGPERDGRPRYLYRLNGQPQGPA